MGWTKCEELMPENGKPVLATYTNREGKRRTIVGYHVERFTVEAGCDDESASEYSEERDEYYLVEGWYEQQDNWGDYSSIFVHEGTVDHWMPLPEPPNNDETHLRRTNASE